MVKRLTMLLAGLFITIGVALAQSQVSGTVTDENGEPIVGAAIRVVGTKTGTVTDGNGRFVLSAPANSQLEITYIGMLPKKVKAGQNVKVVLSTNNTQLDEVMVVAYGTQKKSAFTGSAAVVKSEDLAKHITTNVTDALVGTVSGLQMRGGTGQPGSGTGAMNIRGISSMYAGTEPLIIVDGAPYPASLSNISPNDIESVTVLKDAASAALYGARGASGVIIVTTKTGKNTEAEVSVDIKMGSNSRAVQDYDYITDPGAYYEAYYTQLHNYAMEKGVKDPLAWSNTQLLKQLKYNLYTVPNGETLIGANGKLNPNATLGHGYKYNGVNYYLLPDNWLDTAYKNSFRQEYNVNVKGSNNKISYYTSIGYLKDDGVVEYSGYDRFTARFKADYQAKKWLRTSANVGYVSSKTKSNPNMGTDYNSTNLMYYATMMAPIYPIYVRVKDANGNVMIKKDQYGNDAYDYGVPSNGYGGITRPFLATGNPLGANRYNETLADFNQLNGTFAADIYFTEQLKFNATSSITWGQTRYSWFTNPFYGPGVSTNGGLQKEFEHSMRQNHIQTLTYNNTFDKHSLTAMLGHEYYKSSLNDLSGNRTGCFNPDIRELNAFAKVVDASSYETGYNVEGYFANLLYNFDEKYYGSASFRRDATSRFASKPKDHRWGNFWSVGGAWLISKESFMQNTANWLDQLKLKISVGQQGNDNIPNYAYIDTYRIIKANDTQMAPKFNRLGNEDITWETTTNFNVGLEFSLWKSRLTGSLDVYSKKTSNLLFWLSVPESAGTRGYYGNLGDIRNTGVELNLAGAIIKTHDMEWDLNVNISHNATKILSLPKSKTEINGGFSESNGPRTYQNWFEEGGSLYNAFMPSYAGVNEKGEATYWVDEELKGSLSKPGKNYSSKTTDPNQASRYVHGSVLPDCFGGFGTSFRYKGFDLSLSFDYQIGGKVYDIRYANLMRPSASPRDAGHNIHKDYVKSWSSTNTGSDIPRWQYGDKYTTAVSDRFLTDASYLNFQSFTIGYTFKKGMIPFISKLRIYAAGENLGFISKRKGLDPRYSYDGNTTVSPYSPTRNISGGIQVSF